MTSGSFSFQIVRDLSGFLCGWCNGRGPHLQLTQGPQGSSLVLMWISWCVCSFKQGVRSRLVLWYRTLLSFQAVKEVQASSRVKLGTWGFSQICNRGIRPPLVLLVDSQVPCESMQGNQPYLKWMGKSVSFELWQDPPRSSPVSH